MTRLEDGLHLASENQILYSGAEIIEKYYSKLFLSHSERGLQDD